MLTEIALSKMWGSSMEKLVNLMEETVLEKIDQLWKETDYCKCDRCRMDIAMYALNRLPSRYVRSKEGEVLHKFVSSMTQNDAEITACVYRGIQRIGEDPHQDM